MTFEIESEFGPGVLEQAHPRVVWGEMTIPQREEAARRMLDGWSFVCLYRVQNTAGEMLLKVALLRRGRRGLEVFEDGSFANRKLKK